MKLYTRTGDEGETSLFDGSRVTKDDARVAAYGDVDELNAVLGWVRAQAGPGLIGQRVEAVQHEMFVLGSELATPPDSAASQRIPHLGAEAVDRLETWIDEATAAVAPLRQFILPGGGESASRLHVARTVCRRAERSVIALSRRTAVPPIVVIYLNRLSDLLFAWARQANHEAGQPDILWTPPQ